MTIEQQKTNGLLNLLSPYQDLLRQVVSQLDPASIYNFALVNKLFYRLIFNADNHLLQKNWLASYFGHEAYFNALASIVVLHDNLRALLNYGRIITMAATLAPNNNSIFHTFTFNWFKPSPYTLDEMLLFNQPCAIALHSLITHCKNRNLDIALTAILRERSPYFLPLLVIFNIIYAHPETSKVHLNIDTERLESIATIIMSRFKLIGELFQLAIRSNNCELFKRLVKNSGLFSYDFMKINSPIETTIYSANFQADVLSPLKKRFHQYVERELGNLAMLSDGLAKFIIDLRQNILEIIVSHGGNTAILGHLIKDLDMLELNVLCTNLITSIKCNNSAITDLLLEHLKKSTQSQEQTVAVLFHLGTAVNYEANLLTGPVKALIKHLIESFSDNKRASLYWLIQKMAFQNPQSLKIIKPILFLLLQTFSMSILTEIDKDGLNALDYALTNPMFFKALATLYKEHKNLPPLPDYFVHSMVSKRNYRAVTALLSVDPNAIFQQDQDLNTPLHLTLLLLQSKQNTEQQQQELVAIATVLIPIADLSTENSKGQTPPDLFKALPSVIKNKFSLVLRVSMSSTTDDRLEKIMNMLGHKAYEETEAPVIEKASQISESSTNNNNNGEDENDSHDTNEKSFGA